MAYIGRLVSNNYLYEGGLDDIRIYDRALSASAINDLYHENGWATVTAELSIPDQIIPENDTVRIPINVEFLLDNAFSAFECSIHGYADGLTFLNLDITGGLAGNANWAYAFNEIGDSLVQIGMAGAQDIMNSVVLCELLFLADGPHCQSYPIAMSGAMFNTGADSVTVTDGSVYIEPLANYGDVDQNGQIHAYDASKILKHLVGLDTLECVSLMNAEVNNNDTLSALDASLILQYVVGSIDTLPFIDPLQAQGEMYDYSLTVADSQVIQIPINIFYAENIYSVEEILSIPTNQYMVNELIFDGTGEYSWPDESHLQFAIARTSGGLSDDIVLAIEVTVIDDDLMEIQLTIDELKLNDNLVFENIQIDAFLESETEYVIPEKFTLYPNYPNPFNSMTTIPFEISKNGHVKLIIYDMTGRELRSLVDEDLSPGSHSIIWNGKNNVGAHVPSGIYIVKMMVEDNIHYFKLVLMK